MTSSASSEPLNKLLEALDALAPSAILLRPRPDVGPLDESVYNSLSARARAGNLTLAMPTFTRSLVETSLGYDPMGTPSESGDVSERLRKEPGAVRSPHPYDSFVALGPLADSICNKVGPHAHGAESPLGHLFEMDALCLDLDNDSTIDAECVRHMELLMGVPYLFTRERTHPVITAPGQVSERLCHRLEPYRDIPLNPLTAAQKLFSRMEESGMVYRLNARRRIVWYGLGDFHHLVASLLKHDLYYLLDKEPVIRPYQT